MQMYTYLIVNFLTIIICFVFSFHPKIRFDRHFGAFLKASMLVAIPFVLWDAWFTQLGVWWFNDRYLLGLRVLGLPLEELLFFICIPFSCVFTYYCLDSFLKLDWKPRAEKWLVIISAAICLAIGILYLELLYTTITFFATAATLLFLHYVAKVSWLGKASVVYVILLPGFFMVNGVLTGTGLETPIVNYNSAEFLNIRMQTIPVEDAVYGYALILWNIYFFKKLQRI